MIVYTEDLRKIYMYTTSTGAGYKIILTKSCFCTLAKMFRQCDLKDILVTRATKLQSLIKDM